MAITPWVSGKNKAVVCAHWGNCVSGKYVPAKSPMGVINNEKKYVNES